MTGWHEQVARTADNYRALRNRLAAVAITETSPDGLVRVTVSTDGHLTGLVIKEPRQPVAMADIAARIVGCLAKARSRIPDVLEKAVAETVGTADAGAHLVLADARQKFPAPPPPERTHEIVEEMRISTPRPPEPRPAPRPAPRSARPPAPHRANEDDWTEHSYLEDSFGSDR